MLPRGEEGVPNFAAPRLTPAGLLNDVSKHIGRTIRPTNSKWSEHNLFTTHQDLVG
ncbi:hypothetical protein PBCVMA1D_487R [Paramecium bursaria Chlorella virus MA1D]|nr:hypothetical protein PBCVIL52s1_136R [Paramecium bursaria Chlorella virus IL-5-2s1]AGE54942.1 hypothetical protein PBCVMA1D_487R [Paramecium bursaria Chlorella virus MA1D]